MTVQVLHLQIKKTTSKCDSKPFIFLSNKVQHSVKMTGIVFKKFAGNEPNIFHSLCHHQQLHFYAADDDDDGIMSERYRVIARKILKYYPSHVVCTYNIYICNFSEDGGYTDFTN